jgi:hypothetical protein
MFPLKKGQSPLNKSKPKLKQTHTQFTTTGMGNNYGTGAKAPMGKVRPGSSTVGYKPVTKKQLGTKPKSVV